MRKFPVLMLAAVTALMCGMVRHPAIAQSSNSSANATATGPVGAELKSKIDTRNAKVGDVVKAKTLGQATFGGTTIPKGAILSGKVSQVQSKSAGSGTASLLIVFDQIQPDRKAAPVSVNGVVVAVAPQPSMADAGPSASALPMGSTRSAGNFNAEVGANGGGNSGMSSIQMGSSLRGVTLDQTDGRTAGLLTSTEKDIKLDTGMRIGVQLSNK